MKPDYSKSAEFLFNYSWKGKTKEQIIEKMKLVDYESNYLEQAMNELEKERAFTGFDLTRRIYLLMDLNEKDDGFDENDVEYIR